jgi:hypothetical protein
MEVAHNTRVWRARPASIIPLWPERRRKPRKAEPADDIHPRSASRI